MITGLSDIELAGNQSLKNAIRYLSCFGYQIIVFTFIPNNYPNLQNPKAIFNSNVVFHRLPGVLSALINFGKKIKDLIGKRKINMAPQQDENEERGTYLREYNPIGRIFYMVFLFVLYLPIELCRSLVYSIKLKPSLIYGVNCQGAFVAGLLGWLLKRPVLTRFHGASISKSDLSSLKRRILVLDEIVGLKSKANAVVMTNDGTKGDTILKMLNIEEKKIHFWMNGLDTDGLSLPGNWNADNFRRELGIEGNNILLMVCRLTRWKGIEKGIQCIYKLINEHRMEDVLLVIAGNGPGKEEFENLANQLGVRNSIRFLGGIPHKQVAKYFSIADIFLSLYDVSNLGNPLLEALYCGLPIVTIDDGSTRHLLRNGDNCFLIESQDIEGELPLIVKQLLKDKALRERICSNARKTFKDKVLSWEDRMRLEDQLVRELLRLKSVSEQTS
jgi:glycosyltransferase involved in cell wall biosynthesis